jgi:hypothetical protein
MIDSSGFRSVARGVAFVVAACGAAHLLPAQATPSWSAVEQALGRTGVPQAGEVMRFNFPRRDLRVMVGDVPVRPSLALGSWVAFKRVANGQVMVMGDLVLTNDEINPVISTLQQGGVEQSALHNHVIGGMPNTMYLHVSAHGREVDIAKTIRKALEGTKTPLDTVPAGPPPPFDLDTLALARVLGYTGRINGGVYQVNVPRAEKITESGHQIPPSMGIATAINFQPTGGGKAAITGDFVMIGSEVNPVIRVLRENGIGISALHSHLIDETPRLYFMHFWANDDALKLARGLNAALAKTNSAKANGPKSP